MLMLTCVTLVTSRSIPRDVWTQLIDDGYLSNQDLKNVLATDRRMHSIGNVSDILTRRKKEHCEDQMIKIIEELEELNACNSNIPSRQLMRQYLLGFYGKLQYVLHLYWKNKTHSNVTKEKQAKIAFKVMDLKRAMKNYKAEYGDPKPMHELLANASISEKDRIRFDKFMQMTRQSNLYILQIEKLTAVMQRNGCVNFHIFMRIISDIQMLMQCIGLNIGYPAIIGSYIPPHSIIERYLMDIIGMFRMCQEQHFLRVHGYIDADLWASFDMKLCHTMIDFLKQVHEEYFL